MSLLGTIIVSFLSRAGLADRIAVAGGDLEIERAGELYAAGAIVGYIAMSLSGGEIAIVRQCATGDVDTATTLDAVIDQAVALFGGHALDIGETTGRAS